MAIKSAICKAEEQNKVDIFTRDFERRKRPILGDGEYCGVNVYRNFAENIGTHPSSTAR